MTMTRKLLLVAILALGFSGGSFFLYLATGGSRAEPLQATILPATRPLAEFSLVDHQGAPFTRDSLRGQWTLMFFGFTHCPDICPATLQQLAIARNRVVSDGGEFPAIVLVSVDPERDTPEILETYVAGFGADIGGVTGDMEELIALTKPLGIYFAKSGNSNGNPDGNSADAYSVDHSAVVLLINESAEWQALFSAPHKVENFVHDVPLLTGAR